MAEHATTPPQARANVGPATPAYQLARRLDAMEAWAHALDAQLTHDSSAASNATVRTRELLDPLARQAMIDCQAEQRSDLATRISALECNMVRSSTSRLGDALADHHGTTGSEQVLQRMADLEQRMNDCNILVAKLQELIDLKEYGTGELLSHDKLARIVRAVAGATQKTIRAEQQITALSSQIEALRSS
eukprot:3013477-Amphidinium_carterae.1